MTCQALVLYEHTNYRNIYDWTYAVTLDGCRNPPPIIGQNWTCNGPICKKTHFATGLCPDPLGEGLNCQ